MGQKQVTGKLQTTSAKEADRWNSPSSTTVHEKKLSTPSSPVVMARAFRSVMEVLKWTEPRTLLQGSALVSALWAKVTETDELWTEHIDALEDCFSDVGNLAPKQRYREIVLHRSKDLTVHFLPQQLRVYNYRKQQVVKEFADSDNWIEGRTAAALMTHKSLFVCGGDKRRERAARISLLDGSASVEPNMHDGRSYHSAVVVSHLIYVFGGFPGPCSRSAELFDSQSRTWRKLPAMCTDHSSFTACRREELIYICGGHCGTCETFDLTTERFKQLRCSLGESNWTVSFIYKDEVVSVIGNNFYALKNDKWEKKTGQITLIPWGNMAASVYDRFVYVPMFSCGKLLRIDMETLEGRDISAEEKN